MIRELREIDLKYGFLDCISELGQVDWLHARSVFLERIHSNNIYTYVIEGGAGVISTGTLILKRAYTHNSQNVGLIEDVSTHKEHQGKGYGRQIVMFLIDLARSFGCYKVLLNCSEHNLNFYEKLGFRKYENAMRLDLC